MRCGGKKAGAAYSGRQRERLVKNWGKRWAAVAFEAFMFYPHFLPASWRCPADGPTMPHGTARKDSLGAQPSVDSCSRSLNAFRDVKEPFARTNDLTPPARGDTIH